MTVAAGICYLFALVAELIGVGLVVIEGRDARATLTALLDANPNHNDGGSWAQILLVEKTFRTALGNQIKRRWAVILIVAGIVVGTAGNLLSLG